MTRLAATLPYLLMVAIAIYLAAQVVILIMDKCKPILDAIGG
jgi:hypothetical protein